MHDSCTLRFKSCPRRSPIPYYSQHAWTLTVIYRGTTTFFGHLSWHLTYERNALPYPTIVINVSCLPILIYTSYSTTLCILHYCTYSLPFILLENPPKTSCTTVTQAHYRFFGHPSTTPLITSKQSTHQRLTSSIDLPCRRYIYL